MIRKSLFGNVWFFEDARKLDKNPTAAWGFLPKKKVFSCRTKYQEIEIFDTREFGRILALDGLIQLATKYEFIYHEMLVHPAFTYHLRPRRVLIVGGGDGGALREAVKYPVEEIVLVDIDAEVIEVSRKYLPSLSGGAFSDKRVKVFNEDAVGFMKKNSRSFDIIINDSTDAYGPSNPLWSKNFYKVILNSLGKNGIAGFQTAYFKERFAQRARREIKEIFRFAKVHRAYIGCFPFDECSFTFASKQRDLEGLRINSLEKKIGGMNIETKYYSPGIHRASAVIPKFLS